MHHFTDTLPSIVVSDNETDTLAGMYQDNVVRTDASNRGCVVWYPRETFSCIAVRVRQRKNKTREIAVLVGPAGSGSAELSGSFPEHGKVNRDSN